MEHFTALLVPLIISQQLLDKMRWLKVCSGLMKRKSIVTIILTIIQICIFYGTISNFKKDPITASTQTELHREDKLRHYSKSYLFMLFHNWLLSGYRLFMEKV